MKKDYRNKDDRRKEIINTIQWRDIKQRQNWKKKLYATTKKEKAECEPNRKDRYFRNKRMERTRRKYILDKR